jgi:hypothetical protein
VVSNSSNKSLNKIKGRLEEQQIYKLKEMAVSIFLQVMKLECLTTQFSVAQHSKLLDHANSKIVEN